MNHQTSRSPRRIDFQHPELLQHTFSTEKPPKDSISWTLWLACSSIAKEALESDYIQGIKHGNLHPDNYGQYTVQDATYCYHAQKDYQTTEERAKKNAFPTLAAFAKARRDSYQKYNKQFLDTWHISNGDAIIPGTAVKNYIQFENEVAEYLPPIYGIIAMIPCDELWPWLATELQPNATPGNLYRFWITENNDWHGAYRLDNFIDSWFAKHPDTYKRDIALWVMQSCMTCEVNFFRSACGQSLLPMPSKP